MELCRRDTAEDTCSLSHARVDFASVVCALCAVPVCSIDEWKASVKRSGKTRFVTEKGSWSAKREVKPNNEAAERRGRGPAVLHVLVSMLLRGT